MSVSAPSGEVSAGGGEGRRAPRFFPGYPVAAVAALGMLATAPGQTFILSQLNTELRAAFDLSELMLNTSYTVATVCAALPLVVVGRLTDRIGPRRALALVALCFGLACLALAAVVGPVTLCLAFFLVRFTGQGALSLVSQHAVAMWFHAKLGRINGIKQVVVFGLWTFAPPLAVWLISTLGWRGAYVAFACLVWALVIPPALLFVRDRPEDVGLTLDGDAAPASAEPGITLREATRTRAYWILTAVMVAGPLVGTALLFDIQPLLALRGIDERGAAWAASAWPLATGLVALPAGWLTDRVKPAVLLAAGAVCVAASPLLLLVVTTPVGAAACLALFAVGQTVTGSCAGAAVARVFGRAHHGAIRSSMSRVMVIATGLGPLVSAASVALTGGYTAALLGFGALGVVCGLLPLGLPRDEDARLD